MNSSEYLGLLRGAFLSRCSTEVLNLLTNPPWVILVSQQVKEQVPQPWATVLGPQALPKILHSLDLLFLQDSLSLGLALVSAEPAQLRKPQ